MVKQCYYLLPKCTICSSKKPRFIKKRAEKEIISSLGLKKLLSKVPLLGDILLSVQLPWMQFH